MDVDIKIEQPLPDRWGNKNNNYVVTELGFEKRLYESSRIQAPKVFSHLLLPNPENPRIFEIMAKFLGWDPEEPRNDLRTESWWFDYSQHPWGKMDPIQYVGVSKNKGYPKMDGL